MFSKELFQLKGKQILATCPQKDTKTTCSLFANAPLQHSVLLTASEFQPSAQEDLFQHVTSCPCHSDSEGVPPHCKTTQVLHRILIHKVALLERIVGSQCTFVQTMFKIVMLSTATFHHPVQQKQEFHSTVSSSVPSQHFFCVSCSVSLGILPLCQIERHIDIEKHRSCGIESA